MGSQRIGRRSVRSGSGTAAGGSADGGDDVRAVLDAIRRIVRVLRVSSRAAEKQVGLSGAQLFVLHKLADAPALSLNELAGRTRTHQSSVSVVVQRLVDRGLVARVRSDADGRRLELSLTPQAKALLRKAPGAAQEKLVEALERMPAAGRRQLARLLHKLVHDTGIDGEAAEMFFADGVDGGDGPADDARPRRRGHPAGRSGKG